MSDTSSAQCAGNCPFLLSSMDESTRTSILNRLIEERNLRKYHDIIDVFHESNKEWNQTMHTMLMKFIGGFDNGKAAMELSRRVTYAMIMRERSSLLSVEALLIGTSGLLSLYDARDEYIMRLEQEYRHLAAKYNLSAMDVGQWRLSTVRVHNYPTLRLAQLAACYVNSDISMNSVTQCRSLNDIYRLFSGSASQYWLTRSIPNTTLDGLSPRFGKMKCELLGINFVAQLIYAYGYYTESPTLHERATELLRSIPAEKNKYIDEWNSYTLITKSAKDSQALIQLSREYCLRNKHRTCPINLWLQQEYNGKI